jgi:hypothetical protein
MLKLRERVAKCFMCKKYKDPEFVQYIYSKRIINSTKTSLCHRGVTDFFENEEQDEI